MLSQVDPLLHGVCFDIGFIEINNPLIVVAVAIDIAAQSDTFLLSGRKDPDAIRPKSPNYGQQTLGEVFAVSEYYSYRWFIHLLHAGKLLGKVYNLFEGIYIFVFQAEVNLADFPF